MSDLSGGRWLVARHALLRVLVVVHADRGFDWIGFPGSFVHDYLLMW